jgi:raffinose synthase
VWNRNFVNSVIGVFNIQGASWSRATNQFASLPKPISATLAELCPRDVEGIADRSTPGASFVVRSHRNRRIEILRLKECTSIMLMHKDWEIYTIAELLEHGDIKFAAIGLTAMYNGGGSILRIDMNAKSASVSAYGFGELACYASQAPKSVHVDGRAVSPEFDLRTGALSIDLGATEGTHELKFNW